MRCAAFLAAQWDFIGARGKTPYRGIFARLVTFRHIVQFFPPLIVHIVPQTIVCCQVYRRYFSDRISACFRPPYCRYSFMRTSPNTAPSIYQHSSTYQLVKVLTSSCFPPHTRRKHTHNTRAGKVPNSIMVIIIIMISIRWIYIFIWDGHQRGKTSQRRKCFNWWCNCVVYLVILLGLV